MAITKAPKSWRNRAGVMMGAAVVLTCAATAMITSNVVHGADKRDQDTVDYRAQQVDLERGEHIASDAYARGLYQGHRDAMPVTTEAGGSDVIIVANGLGGSYHFRLRAGRVLAASGGEVVRATLPAGCDGFNPHDYDLSADRYTRPETDPRQVSCVHFWEGSENYTEHMRFF